MNGNFLKNLSKGKHSPGFTKATDALCVQLKRLLDAPQCDQRSVKLSMTPLYWETFNELVRAKFPLGRIPEKLIFSPEEELFLNYGFISPSLCLSPASFYLSDGGCWPVQTMTEWLQENFYACFPSFGDCLSLTDKNIKNGLAAEEKEKNLFIKLKIILPCILSSASRSRDMQRNAEELLEIWERNIIPYSAIFTKTTEWVFADTTKRNTIASGAKKFIEAEERLQSLLKTISDSPGCNVGERVINLLEECRQTALLKTFLSKEMSKAAQKQERLVRKTQSESGGAREVFFSLLDEKCVQIMAAAKKTEKLHSPIMDKNASRNLVSSEKIQFSMQSVLSFDPEFLSVKRMKMYGLPKFLIFPGRGGAGYDWSDNTILLPGCPAGGNTEAAVLMGCASYRWDTDEKHHFTDSFGRLSKNKKNNTLEASRVFLRDYYVWIAKKIRNSAVFNANFPPDVKKWFKEHFSRRKDNWFRKKDSSTKGERLFH